MVNVKAAPLDSIASRLLDDAVRRWHAASSFKRELELAGLAKRPERTAIIELVHKVHAAARRAHDAARWPGLMAQGRDPCEQYRELVREVEESLSGPIIERWIWETEMKRNARTTDAFDVASDMARSVLERAAGGLAEVFASTQARRSGAAAASNTLADLDLLADYCRSLEFVLDGGLLYTADRCDPSSGRPADHEFDEAVSTALVLNCSADQLLSIFKAHAGKNAPSRDRIRKRMESLREELIARG